MGLYTHLFLCFFYILLLVLYLFDGDEEHSIFYALLNLSYFIEAFC